MWIQPEFSTNVKRYDYLSVFTRISHPFKKVKIFKFDVLTVKLDKKVLQNSKGNYKISSHLTVKSFETTKYTSL